MLFGEITDCNMRLNETGTIVQQTWEDLPTHYHGIDLRRHAIPEILRGFKTFSARRVNERAGKGGVLWQRGYYEHVIRNEKALDRIRAYIANNPARWADDPENISRAASAETGRV